jgi:hypothetical protein
MNPLRSLKAISAALALAAALGFAGCKSGADDEGMVNVGLTDAAGDFLSYTVDVTSLSLTKDDGKVVETLPQRTRVDLARLTDLSEFVTAASVPSGTYVSVTLNLDFSNADIEVDKGDGTAVQVAGANILDAQGGQVSTLSMVVKFDGTGPLKIAPLTPVLFDLDFNLAASNTVDMTNPASPVVTVNPLLVAAIDPDAPKPHRIRGPLASVNVQSGSFTLVLRPFNLVQGDHGRLTFTTDTSTQFEINQVSIPASTGIQAMSGLPPLTAVVALGTLVPGTRQFLATEVRAGSSVVFGTRDVLTGNVLARSGNTLTVKGAELVRNDGTLIFRDTVSVTVAVPGPGPGTKVTKQGVPAAATIADISVGQRIMVFGTLDAPGTSMDATAGLARLLVTQLNGTATSVGGGLVGMALARIDGRPVSLFNFSGTGTPGNDADPTAYVVSAGALNGIVNGTPLKVRGFPFSFNAAGPAGDFNAVTLIDVTNSPATLAVGWPALEPAPFTFVAGGVSVNLTNAGLLHDVFRDGVDTPLLKTDTPKALTNQGRGLFVIGIDGTVQVFTQFAAYQQALQIALGSGKQARSFVAAGSYVDATKTLAAGVMATALH